MTTDIPGAAAPAPSVPPSLTLAVGRPAVTLIVGGLVATGLAFGTSGGFAADATLSPNVRSAADWTNITGIDAGLIAINRPRVMIANEIPTLARALRSLHDESGLTWDQLAKLFGVSRRAVHAWAAGARMNDHHARWLTELTAAIRGLPGDDPATRRAYLLAPGDDNRSLFERLRMAAVRGEPFNISPFDPWNLLDVQHDRDVDHHPEEP